MGEDKNLIINSNLVDPQHSGDKINPKEIEKILRKFQDEAELYDSKKNEKVKEEIQNLKQNRELRKDYARRTFNYLYFWSISVLILISLSALNNWELMKDFEIPQPVLLTLAGGTTASALGLVALIIKGLFNVKEEKKEKEEPKKAA